MSVDCRSSHQIIRDAVKDRDLFLTYAQQWRQFRNLDLALEASLWKILLWRSRRTVYGEWTLDILLRALSLPVSAPKQLRLLAKARMAVLVRMHHFTTKQWRQLLWGHNITEWCCSPRIPGVRFMAQPLTTLRPFWTNQDILDFLQHCDITATELKQIWDIPCWYYLTPITGIAWNNSKDAREPLLPEFVRGVKPFASPKLHSALVQLGFPYHEAVLLCSNPLKPTALAAA